MANVSFTWGTENEVDSSFYLRTFKITFPSSYTTGGDGITQSDIDKMLPGVGDLTKAHMIVVSPKSGYVFEVDRTAKTVKAYTAGGSQLSGGNAALNGLITEGLVFYNSDYWTIGSF